MVPWCECDKREILSSRLQPGDIVFARTGATTGKSFLIDTCPPETVFASYLIRLRLGPSAEPHFVSHFFQSADYWNQITRNARGAAQPGINATILRSLEIPLPPLPEQRRIADILDRADALRAKRRAALARLDELTQAIFIEMFESDKSFPKQRLDAVCELITDGTHYTPTYSETGTIFLSSRNVTSGYITWDDVKYIPESLHIELCRRVSPKINDVLLAKNGTTGISAIVDRDCIFDIYVSLALLRPSKLILPIFLQQAINAPTCTRQFNAALKGIGVPNLHLKEIRKTSIPLPPIELQRQFARRILAVERSKSLLRSAQLGADALFASLQDRAFRGAL